MYSFLGFFLILFVVYVVWVSTLRRRLKGRGDSALDSFVPLPIEEAELIALQENFESELQRHYEVWSKIGGLEGLRSLRENAARLIEAWQDRCAHIDPAASADLDRSFSRLGLCVLMAALEAAIIYAMRFFGSSRRNLLPPIHATYAVRFYAEIQVTLRTLCEAHSPETLAILGTRV